MKHTKYVLLLTPLLIFAAVRWLSIPLAHRGPEFYDVEAYGASPNDGVDDTTPIKNALDAANTAGGVVRFGAGVYLYDPGALTGDKYKISKSLSIRGAGVGVTKVTFPATASVYYAFWVDSVKLTLNISDISFVGPTTVGVLGEDNPLPFLVYKSLAKIDYSDTLWLNINNVRVENAFVSNITLTATSSYAKVTVENSRLEARDAEIHMYTGTSNPRKELICRNVLFDRGGIPEWENTGHSDAYGHHIYIHPSVNWDINNCTFNRCWGPAIHFYGASWGGDYADYARLTNCLFTDSCSSGVYSTRWTGTIVARGNTFNNPSSSFNVTGDLSSSSNKYNKAGISLQGGGVVALGQKLNFVEDEFALTLAQACAVDSTYWNYSACTFKTDSFITSAWASFLNISGDCFINVDKCHVFTGHTSDPAIRFDGFTGVAYIRDTDFTGNWKNGAIYITGTNYQGVFNIIGNDFTGTIGNAIHSNINNHNLRGFNNRFSGIYTDGHGNLSIINSQSVDTLTSATTITLDY
jgi:hypothetical protein